MCCTTCRRSFCRSDRARSGDGDLLQLERGGKQHVRSALVEIGEEEIERIGLPHRQSERVEVDIAGLRVVNSAQIDDQFSVDIDEYVVVAAIMERFAATVDEGGVGLGGE